MKHIKRKFLQLHKLENNINELFQNAEVLSINSSLNDDKVPWIITTDNESVQGFFYNIKGKRVIIPEPNPIVIYFSNAQGFLADLLKHRGQLLEELQSPNPELGNLLNSMFAFYGCSVNFCSSLFDSLEAFINSKIPKNYTYINAKGKKLKKYEEIRYLSFEDKIKIVLPDIYPSKNLLITKGHIFEQLKLLKKLRDDITHAKSDINFEVNYYEKLFTEALDFDYVRAIEGARDFINFYEKDLIEPCDCGLEH